MKRKKVIICIPARYGSSRFPGKVLALLGGKPIIQWVYDKARSSNTDDVIVATEDKVVYDVVVKFGGKCIMTSKDHPSGTDRIHEAVKGIDYDTVINIQGDEPLIEVETVNRLINLMESNKEVEMGTVVVKADRRLIANNPNVVKAVLAKDNSALYFSRSEIPYSRERDMDAPIYQHLGIYGYKKATLEKFVSLPPSMLEKCEMLEQLRAIENGIKIHTIIADSNYGSGIDTPDDLAKTEAIIAESLKK